MPDAIFRFVVTLGQFCDHQVKPSRRIQPARWGISDGLAKDELIEHVETALDCVWEAISAQSDDMESIRFRVCNYRIALAKGSSRKKPRLRERGSVLMYCQCNAAAGNFSSSKAANKKPHWEQRGFKYALRCTRLAKNQSSRAK